jgi:hypothetical protein
MTPSEEVKESAELAVGIATARLELYRKDEVVGVARGTVGCPAIGEQAHAVPGQWLDSPRGQHGGELVDAVASRVETETVDLPAGVERVERAGPVAFECRAHGEHIDVLGHDRNKAVVIDERAERVEQHGRVVEVHEHPVAQDTAETRAGKQGRRFLTTGLDQSHAPANGIVFRGNEPLGTFEHRSRRVNDGDLIALARERDALVPGATAHVDDMERRRREVSSQMLMNDMGANSSA